jgi:hypothetical protein
MDSKFTIMPRGYVEMIVAYFNDHPERNECKVGISGVPCFVVKREDLPKLVESLKEP